MSIWWRIFYFSTILNRPNTRLPGLTLTRLSIQYEQAICLSAYLAILYFLALALAESSESRNCCFLVSLSRATSCSPFRSSSRLP